MSDEVETVEEEESAPSIGDELRDAIAASDEATEEETEEVKVEPETSEEIPEKDATPEEGVEKVTGQSRPNTGRPRSAKVLMHSPKKRNRLLLLRGNASTPIIRRG